MPRKNFTKKTQREAYKRSAGKCEAVGRLYGLDRGKRCYGDLTKGVEYDHVLRDCDGGDNSLENCLAVCKQCHSYKTRKFDIPQAAKTKRMGDKAKGISLPKQKIQGGGFYKTPKQPKIDKQAIARSAVKQSGGIARQFGE